MEANNSRQGSSRMVSDRTTRVTTDLETTKDLILTINQILSLGEVRLKDLVAVAEVIKEVQSNLGLGVGVLRLAGTSSLEAIRMDRVLDLSWGQIITTSRKTHSSSRLTNRL